jgi:hypothetical protein
VSGLQPEISFVCFHAPPLAEAPRCSDRQFLTQKSDVRRSRKNLPAKERHDHTQ